MENNTDQLRDMFQNLLVEGDKTTPGGGTAFAKKNPKHATIVEQIKGVLIENGLEIKDQRVIAMLAIFSENLYKIIS